MKMYEGATLAAGNAVGKQDGLRNIGMGAQEVRDTPEIQHSLDTLEREIITLGDVYQALFTRLAPVVRSIPTSGGNNQKDPNIPVKCELASIIDGKAIAVRRAREAAEVVFANLAL